MQWWICFDIPGEDSEVVHIIKTCLPVSSNIPCPDAKDVVNKAFELEKVDSMHWDRLMDFLVGEIYG